MAGQVTKWAIALAKYDFEYVSRKSLKGQSLFDFLLQSVMEANSREYKAVMEKDEVGAKWRVYVDGVANKEGCGIKIKAIALEGTVIKHVVILDFQLTNNKAEYEPVIAGL